MIYHRPLHLILTFLFAFFTVLDAAEEKPSQPYEQLVTQRLREGLDFIASSRAMTSTKPSGQDIWKALLLLNENKNIEEAEKHIVVFCGKPLTEYLGKPVAESRTEAALRIYLTDKTRRLISPKTKATIEDFAWELLTKYNCSITRADADKPFWTFCSSRPPHSPTYHGTFLNKHYDQP